MANAEHLKILKEGVEVWNIWRNTNPFVTPDLSYSNLSDSDLSNANLTHANLFNANLSRTKCINTNFSFANMARAILSGAQLDYAYFYRSDLSESQLIDLDWSKCQIGGTNFAFTNLFSCIGLDKVVVEGPCPIDFQTLLSLKKLPKDFLVKIGLPEFLFSLPEIYQIEGIRYYPVFLSHSSINKAFARKLYEALIAQGVNVFFDEKKMMPGDDLYESISKGIDYYDKLILVCSKESLSDSWWVDREIDRILAKERDLFKEVGQRVNLLIPITIDDYVFREWNGAKKEDVKRYIVGDFKNWQDDAAFEDSLNKLIHALNVDRPDVRPVSHLPRRPNP